MAIYDDFLRKNTFRRVGCRTHAATEIRRYGAAKCRKNVGTNIEAIRRISVAGAAACKRRHIR